MINMVGDVDTNELIVTTPTYLNIMMTGALRLDTTTEVFSYFFEEKAFIHFIYFGQKL